MVDELLEITHDLATTLRAYLVTIDRQRECLILRERLESLLHELSKRNL